MRTWNVIYKWASGTGVAERITPPVDVHGGHQGSLSILSFDGNVPPTNKRVKRAIVNQLYRAHVHGDRYGWRIDRKISVLPQGTSS